MNNLSAFLHPVKEENLRFVASKRFVNEDGTFAEWEVRALSGEEDENLRKKCTKRIQVPGKMGQFTNETDYNQYLGLMAATCTVEPNLYSSELQDAYGVMGADALLKKMLKPGEYADYLGKIQEINGFDTTFADKVEEAKN